ncbi:MAG: ATP-binding protein [Nocardioides sp.]
MGTSLAVDVVLPALPSSAGRARRLVRDALAPLTAARSFASESLDSAQLAISEVVTNALLHAGTPVRLRVLVAGARVRFEVGDGSAHLPVNRSHAPAAGTGRGLHLVAEVADRWGVYRDDGGKVVWFELQDTETGSEHGEGPSGSPGAEPPGAHEIELRNVPLLMHAAWQEHAAALLREVLLTRIEDEPEALEQHAAASDALGLLCAQVPPPEVDDDAESIMANATEPGVSAPRVVLRIPEDAVRHFDDLDTMLDSAAFLADAGDLMSTPIQPEMRALRRWMCDQIRRQSTGGPPERWSSPTGAPPATGRPLVWDSDSVTAAPEALVAADDASRIVAVSRPALALLGYDDPGELVGERLLRIIPERYHQAHIAGFTLHLTNGRSPLIGTLVTVPVRRRDGDETSLGLNVTLQHLVDGRPVFVAELHT